MRESVFEVKSSDGYPLQVKLSMPDDMANKLVVFVNGSGPNTYDIKRQLPDGTFYYYHDLFAKEFTSRVVAYCRYSTRGVTESDNPPFFININEEEYRTYLPHNSVSDVESIITYLANNGYGHCSVHLLGWSEGTIFAPLVALNSKVKVNSLLLAGYCNENLRDTLIWQLSGNSMFMQCRRVLDYDKKGYISKEDFDEDRYKVREYFFGDMDFEKADEDGDGVLTVKDFESNSMKHLQGMLNAINNNDDEWLKNNHGVTLTSGWFKEHFELEANKNILPNLALQIHIFSGEYDTMTPQFYALNIKDIFDQSGKHNLTVHCFDNHDHDLNYIYCILKNNLSEGIEAIFDAVDKMM